MGTKEFSGKAVLAGAVAGLALTAGAALAQDMSALEARIAKLEEEALTGGKGSVTTGTGIDLTFYGYVRADAYKDFDYNLGANNLGFGALTPTSPEDGKFGSHAYQTRLGVRGSAGDMKFNFEGDFYGSGGGSFRIRHAYGEYAGFLFGQTWSNWNSDANPAFMMDFNGVPGGAGYRAVQVRYTHKLSDEMSVAVSAEDDPASYKAAPILTAALRYAQGTTNYKLALASRKIETLDGDDVSGWGGSLGVNAKPWEGGSFSGVVMMGEGVSGLVNFSNGVGQQAGGATEKGTYDLDINGDTVGIKGYGFSLSQALTPKFELGISYGHYDYDDFAGAVASSTETLDAGILTAKYKPTENIILALEYMKLQKGFFGGGDIQADRLLGVAQFSF